MHGIVSLFGLFCHAPSIFHINESVMHAYLTSCYISINILSCHITRVVLFSMNQLLQKGAQIVENNWPYMVGPCKLLHFCYSASFFFNVLNQWYSSVLFLQKLFIPNSIFNITIHTCVAMFYFLFLRANEFCLFLGLLEFLRGQRSQDPKIKTHWLHPQFRKCSYSVIPFRIVWVM